MKKIVVSLLLLIGVLLIGAFFYLQKEASHQPKLPEKKEQHSQTNGSNDKSPQNIPTVFIHGYSGGKRSFGGMISRLEKKNEATASLVATIAPNGEITYRGNYDPKAKNPLIQVLFEDNKNTDGEQIIWIRTLFLSLKENYQIDNLNAVGHSLGGVSLTSYITQTGSNPDYPHLNKLVIIAAPLNGLVIGENGVTDYDLTPSGPKTETPNFESLRELKQQIPSDLSVLTIAGDKEDGTKSDGSVSVASALSARFIYQDVIADYREMTFTGLTAAHSLLHENKGVDAAVAEFLWHE